MKKVLIPVCMVIALTAVSTPMATVQDAHAMMTLGCTTAADFGWAHWGWNMICRYEMLDLGQWGEWENIDPFGEFRGQW